MARPVDSRCALGPLRKIPGSSSQTELVTQPPTRAPVQSRVSCSPCWVQQAPRRRTFRPTLFISNIKEENPQEVTTEVTLPFRPLVQSSLLLLPPRSGTPSLRASPHSQDHHRHLPLLNPPHSSRFSSCSNSSSLRQR